LGAISLFALAAHDASFLHFIILDCVKFAILNTFAAVLRTFADLQFGSKGNKLHYVEQPSYWTQDSAKRAVDE